MSLKDNLSWRKQRIIPNFLYSNKKENTQIDKDCNETVEIVSY